jgi:tRNA(adenine34) deaminase
MTDREAMQMAIDAARSVWDRGQRPIGCVITNEEGAPIAVGRGSETPIDPTWHSEMVAIRHASSVMWAKGRRYCEGLTIYSTHEPCTMCAGAITHAGFARVVFGSYRADLPELFKAKRAQSLAFEETTHPPEVLGGFMHEECIALFDEEIRHARNEQRQGGAVHGRLPAVGEQGGVPGL